MVERELTMQDLITAIQQKRVIEMFGAGTAATIASIAKIGYQGVLLLSDSPVCSHSRRCGLHGPRG